MNQGDQKQTEQENQPAAEAAQPGAEPVAAEAAGGLSLEQQLLDARFGQLS